MVRAMAGSDWSEETSWDLTEPVNLLDLYVRVISPNLISQNPRCLISTFSPDARPAAKAMEQWLNDEIERLNFAETMQRVATDALFSIGICKVALAAPDDAAGSAWHLQAGQPFVTPIDLDDFVYDLHARKFSECSFIGHRVRKPLDAVQSSKLYSKYRKNLVASRDPAYNQQGDQRVGVLGRGFRGANHEDYEPMVDLWEIYLPRHNLMLTFESNDGGDPVVCADGEPLRVQKWVGPDCGPIHILGYGVVPGNAMPKGPVQAVFKLHEVENHLYRKLIRQAQDQKTVVGIAGSADSDGNRIVQASDGQVIKMDDPKSVATMQFNGPDQQNFLFADHIKQLFGYMVGNMDSYGGLSPQAKTFGENKLLAESSSRLITDMQARTTAYASRVLKSLAWFHWEHPFNEQTTEYPIAGMKRGIVRTLYPRDATDGAGQPRNLRRQVPFEDLKLRVDPYSTQAQSPAERLAGMNEVVTQVVIPMMQLLQSQGIAFDMHAYLEKVGKYKNLPDLAEIMTIQEPPVDATGPSHDGPKMPQSTNREYTRHNVPMRSEKGASQQLQASLSGVDVGGAQKNGQMMGVGR